MKKISAIAIITLVTLLTLSQFGCATPPNPPSTNANMPTPEATPDPAAIEKELLRIENDWPRVIKERDGQAVRRLDADDAYLLSWHGRVSGIAEHAKVITSG